MRDWEALEPDVTKLLTKHYTPHAAGRKVDKVVVHYNAGNLTVEGCWSVWQAREASAHYQVESSGRVGQLVYDKDIAWHAGVWSVNESSIGIEHANLADGTITEECLDAGSHLVAALCVRYKLGRPEWLKNVFPHRHFKATSCPGQIYGSQKDAYIKRAQHWYDSMKDGDDDMTPEQSKMLKECHHQLTRTDDPTGRGACQDFYVHEKFLAGLAQDVNKKVEDIQGKVDEINARLAKLEKKIG